jgi:hypothetical protein
MDGNLGLTMLGVGGGIGLGSEVRGAEWGRASAPHGSSRGWSGLKFWGNVRWLL